jgi:hypothetical protein
MNLGVLLIKLGPILVAAAIAYFLYCSDRRQRIAVLLAWLFPGLGHWWIGARSRAILFAATLVPLFIAGLVISDFLSVSPFERHPIWGLAQLPGGLMTAITWLATSGLVITRDNPYYGVGLLYTGSACLLNLLAMCDVWDLTEPAARREKREQKAARS